MQAHGSLSTRVLTTATTQVHGNIQAARLAIEHSKILIIRHV